MICEIKFDFMINAIWILSQNIFLFKIEIPDCRGGKCWVIKLENFVDNFKDLDFLIVTVVRALAMLAGDQGSIPGHAINFSNFSEGIGKSL